MKNQIETYELMEVVQQFRDENEREYVATKQGSVELTKEQHKSGIALN